MSSSDKKALSTIKELCRNIFATIKRFGLEYDKFVLDEDYQRSITFSIFQIGVQIEKLSEPVKRDMKKCAPCKSIKSIHDGIYDSCPKEDVWSVALKDIPVVGIRCAQMLDREHER